MSKHTVCAKNQDVRGYSPFDVLKWDEKHFIAFFNGAGNNLPISCDTLPHKNTGLELSKSFTMAIKTQ